MKLPSSPWRALALDFGRVLTDEPDSQTFDPILGRLGVDRPAFDRAYGRSRLDFDRGTLDARTYWSRVLTEAHPGLGVGSDLVDQVIEADFQSWAQPRTTFHRFIQGLLAQGVPTAIVSNMPPGVGDRFVAHWPWLAELEHRFFSADFGAVKPEDGFYRRVLDETGWSAPQVLFVDDLAVNLAAAARWGFATLEFTGSSADLETITRWCNPVVP